MTTSTSNSAQTTISLEPQQSEEAKQLPTVVAPQPLNLNASTTKSYRVLVTDTFNVTQINQTLTWLKSSSKPNSRTIQIEVFPWEKATGWDEEEAQKWIRDGEIDAEVLNHMKIDGWSGVLLDAEGYEVVCGKKEWVRSVVERRGTTSMNG